MIGGDLYAVVVEDDHQQVDDIEATLEQHLPGIEISVLKTESAFYAWVAAVQRVPTVFIIDVMLRWADPSPEAPPSPDFIRTEGHYTAGLRCLRLLRQQAALRKVPVILYTVVEKADIEDHIARLHNTLSGTGKMAYLVKDFDVAPLAQLVKTLTAEG